MEWKAFSAVRADQPQENLSRVALSLDLDTAGILNAERPGDDLLRRREQIRGELCRAMAEQLIPRITENMAGAIEAPENWSVRNEGKVDSAWTIGDTPGGAVMTHHRMDAGFTFEAGQAMNPATALYLSRGNVAAALADHFLFTLEQRYFGKEQAEFDVRMTVSEDGIRSYWVPEASARLPDAAREPVSPVLEPGVSNTGAPFPSRPADGTGRRAGMDSVAANESFLSRVRASVENAEECLRKYGCSVPALRQRAEKTEAHLKSVQGCLTEGLKRWQQAADAGRELEAADWRGIIASDTRIMERFTGELRELRQDLARWTGPGDAYSEAP